MSEEKALSPEAENLIQSFREVCACLRGLKSEHPIVQRFVIEEFMEVVAHMPPELRKITAEAAAKARSGK